MNKKLANVRFPSLRPGIQQDSFWLPGNIAFTEKNLLFMTKQKRCNELAKKLTREEHPAIKCFSKHVFE